MLFEVSSMSNMYTLVIIEAATFASKLFPPRPPLKEGSNKKCPRAKVAIYMRC